VPQIGEFASRIREITKLGGVGFILLFQVALFTLFNCELVKPRNISIIQMSQIGKFANEVRETTKFGGVGFIFLL
jgi:hypothetical protein